MHKYLVSLDKDQHRRQLFFSQADTQDFQLFSAINSMQQNWQELGDQFDLIKFSQHYQRQVTKGEIGCTLSHLAVYRLIAQDQQISDEEYCLICEDDALFQTKTFQTITALLQQQNQADLILVGQSKIKDFKHIELELNFPTTFSFARKKIAHSPFCYAYPYKNYFAGTVAYLIKKSTAKKFISIIDCQLPYWLADDFILFGNKFNLDILVIRPLMVIENPTLVSNLQSQRGSEKNNLIKKLIKYPAKKLLAVKRNMRAF